MRRKVYVGPVVREEIEESNVLREEAIVNLSKIKPVLLIMGGSQRRSMDK